MNTQSRRVIQFIFYAYCIAAILLTAVQIGMQWWGNSSAECVQQSRLEAAHDPDVGQWLLPGLAAKTNLLQTLSWWHGTWAGQVPFWRPLTSYGLWAEYRLFGPERFDRWYWVSVASHLVFTLTLFFFARSLTHRQVAAALAALIFAASTSFSPFAWFGDYLSTIRLPIFGFDLYPPAAVALSPWKNQPEAWTGTLTVLAMICALKRRWAWCLVCTGLSIGFKESGWLTFTLVGVILWTDNAFTTIPHRVWRVAGVLALTLVSLRAASGWSVFYGYHLGSNGHWAKRLAFAALGPYLSLFLRSASVPQALLGTALFLAAFASSVRRSMRVAGALCTLVIAAVIEAHVQGGGFIVGVAALLMWGTGLENVMLSFLWLAGFAALWKDLPRRLLSAIVLLVLISATPLAAAAQVQAHVLYLSSAFASILVALTLMAVLDRMNTMAAGVGSGRSGYNHRDVWQPDGK